MTNSGFNFFVFCLIIGNTAVLSIDDYPSNKSKQATLAILNDIFTFVFLGECLFKIVGLGPKNYFKDNFNLFDSIVVLISIIDYTIAATVPKEDRAGAADILQVVRCLRLLRVIKIARQWASLQELLRKIG